MNILYGDETLLRKKEIKGEKKTRSTNAAIYRRHGFCSCKVTSTSLWLYPDRSPPFMNSKLRSGLDFGLSSGFQRCETNQKKKKA